MEDAQAEGYTGQDSPTGAADGTEESYLKHGPMPSNQNKNNADRGILQPLAAKVLMKILYGARMARLDMLRAVCNLACFVTRWTTDCDAKLHRLVHYIACTKHPDRLGG